MEDEERRHLGSQFDGDAEGPSEQLLANIVSMLKELSIACENVVSSDPMDDVLKDFDVFSLPAVLIYNSQSELHKRFVLMQNPLTPSISTMQKHEELHSKNEIGLFLLSLFHHSMDFHTP